MTNFSIESLKMRGQKTFLEILETFWISMYERGYIEIDDVYSFQKWILALAKIGYNFPDCNTNISSTTVQHRESQDIENLNVKVRSLAQRVTNEKKLSLHYQQQVQEKCQFLDNQINKTCFGLSDVHTGVTTDFTSVVTSMVDQKVLLLGIAECIYL